MTARFMELGRRQFLAGGGLAAGALLLPFVAGFPRRAVARDYGDLVPDPDQLLELPEGFSYRILETWGTPMDDGYDLPGLPDAMGCFLGRDGNWILMRNHEVPPESSFHAGWAPGGAPPEAFDAASYGGVTRLVIDPRTGERISSNLVLAGTNRNCAGGLSPWGWLSCEEDDVPGHGYVFLCDPEAASVLPADRKVVYGRFTHEAATVDPATSICYLTEDRGNSCFYRFVPDDAAEPFVGRLQALRVVGQDGVDTGTWDVGAPVEVDWVDLDDTDPVGDTLRDEAQLKGAATFSRGEGLWIHDGEVWFSCTSGGPAQAGQIFKLVDGADGGSLELVVASPSADVLDYPDNLCVSPWGQLFIAEDGEGGNFIRVLTDTGELRPFARAVIALSEFAGLCFSPDGTTLFLNLQLNGLTIAVTGPFPRVPGGGDTGDESSGSDGGSGTGVDDDGSGEIGTAATVGETSTGESGTEAGADDDGGAGGGCGCNEGEPGIGAMATALALAIARPRDGGG